VPETSPARRIARLSTELRVTGLGQFALGLACLVAALTGSDLEPVRAVIPFLVAFAVMGAFSVYGSRWLRLAEILPAPGDARVEEHSATTRRSLVKVAVGLLLTALAVSLGPVFAVVFGGLLCAVGTAELRDYTWLRDRENASGREILRELGRFPLAGGGRSLYTRPLSESTLAT
jgi:hypothetical protein